VIFSFLFSSFSLRFLSSKTTPTKLTLSQRLGVGHHLLLVRNKFSALRLVQRAGQSGDGVVVGPSLESREHREIDLVLDVVGDLLSLLVDGADACFVGEGVEGCRWGGGGGELSSMKKNRSFFLFHFFLLKLSLFASPPKQNTNQLTLAVEDHRAARAAQRLVRRGGDDVGVLEGARDQSRGDEARDVGHVGKEPRVFVF